MESPRKNNDCYFYYYSTCTKGDSCTFRHEPSALGCETTCSFWKEGKCINVRCNFRHMELRKNRKVIPCYWESQPGGCLKPHCPFLHQNPKHPSLSENQGGPSDIKTQDLNKATAIQNTDSCSKNASQGNEKNFGSPVVDPLVVNFEEESDNESAPTQSPVKMSRSVKVKTLEEIRLERIQAESAAYYSYPETADNNVANESAEDLRRRIIKRLNMKPDDEQQEFQILSLNEIRNRKKKFSSNESHLTDEDKPPNKRQKISLRSRRSDLSQVRIKTLDEIRAERAKKFADVHVPVSSSNETKQDVYAEHVSSDSEVSSTSKCDAEIVTVQLSEDCNKTQCIAKVQPRQRLKRQRSSDKVVETNVKTTKFEVPDKIDVLIGDKTNGNSADVTLENEEVKADITRSADHRQESAVTEELTGTCIEKNKESSPVEKMSLDSSKLDEVLLLEEEEYESSDNLKAEEDILKDIDELLNE